jgi:hypothetical protein
MTQSRHCKTEAQVELGAFSTEQRAICFDILRYERYPIQLLALVITLDKSQRDLVATDGIVGHLNFPVVI